MDGAAQMTRGQAMRDATPAGAEVRRLPMKIFQIGFNKCGTGTIHNYLRANGVSSVHWDRGNLAKRLFANLANDDDLLAGYEQFDAFTDMEFLDYTGTYLEGYKLFPHLAAQYPDAVFILNTRDREAWIRSRLEHGTRPYLRRQMLHYGVASVDEVTDRWRAEWERHHRRVVEFFGAKPHRFFVCRIETDLPHLLNEKLPECELDDRYYQLCTPRRSLLLRRAQFVVERAKSLLG
jgi:hypothetical protein